MRTHVCQAPVVPSSRWITVRSRSWGQHCWPSAPASRSYLAGPHRHLFTVELSVEVDHADREIEFHDLLDELGGAWPESLDLGSSSCEMLAEMVLRNIASAYPGRRVQVRVYEDTECWATVEGICTE